MRKEREKTASATVFFLLTLLLVLSFTFSLLEAARIHCLNRQTSVSAELCIQSMFGNFNAELWENYQLLLMDGAWQGETFSMRSWETQAMEEAMVTAGDNRNLFLYRPLSVQVLEYELVSDREGDVFRRQVSKQMQKQAAAELLDELLGIESDSNYLETQKKEADDAWKSAWDAVSEAEEIATEQETQEKQGSYRQSEEEGLENEKGNQVKDEEFPRTELGENTLENPMEYVKALKGAPILGAVLSDPSSLSLRSIEGPFLQDRDLCSGNWQQQTDTGAMDRLFLQYFIYQYLTNGMGESAVGPKEHALAYETEYIIGGKGSDSENLERVVWELLAIREASNFVTLMQDGEKKGLALGVATAAVGFTGMPPLIKAVQIGVLLAWAFVESILDIRALLHGKKVPLLKTPNDWSSDITNCKKTVEDKKQSEDEEKGLSYGQYLQILLFLLADKTINYRTMDILEKNLRLTEGNGSVCMDSMIASVRSAVRYEAKPLFWNFIFTEHRNWYNFEFSREVSLSY